MGMLNRLFRHAWWRYAIPAAAGIAVTLLLSRRGGFSPRAWMDGLTTAGAVLVLWGLLSLVTYHGAFDMFGYAFSTFGNRRYRDLVEYSTARQEKRRSGGWVFGPPMAVGLLLLLIGGLIRIVL